MKKLLLSAMLVGLATGAYAQGAGTINLDNHDNPNTSPTATSGGLVFLDTGGGPALMTTDFNVALFGFTDSATVLTHPVASMTGANATGDNIFGNGTFFDLAQNSYPVDGTTTASATAFFILQAWIGNTSFATATYTAQSPVFSNPLGGTGQPPSSPQEVSGMPALIVTSVPEPSTFALAGLGAAALLIFRRRK